MSDNASCLFASTARRPVLAGRVTHDPEQARRIAAAFPGGPWVRVRDGSLEAGLYPSFGELWVGAYGDTVVVTHDDLSGAIDDEGGSEPTPHVAAVQRMLPGSRILVSVIARETWGYAWFERGRCVRTYAGELGHRVFCDHGEPVPEDRVWGERRLVVDDEPCFHWVDELGRVRTATEADAGYEITEAQSLAFLGYALLDYAAAERLPMEMFSNAEARKRRAKEAP
ncbi:MAG: hypothetical protein JNM10_11960 [Planctomycetia bacterium]|nr:hypothetical protein [Planctomycetia bacterium]